MYDGGRKQVQKMTSNCFLAGEAAIQKYSKKYKTVTKR